MISIRDLTAGQPLGHKFNYHIRFFALAIGNVHTDDLHTIVLFFQPHSVSHINFSFLVFSLLLLDVLLLLFFFFFGSTMKILSHV